MSHEVKKGKFKQGHLVFKGEKVRLD